MSNGRDLYHRHYCPKGHRVFPYDSMESLTVAPKPGASGKPILLYSYNSALREKNPENIARQAYCWVCKEWVETTRENRFDTQLRYLRRAGVQFRFPNGKVVAEPPAKIFVKNLDLRMEERRAVGGVVTLKR